ncbi:hypothetical protein [Halomarina rubra]|uniref:Uncharacterized protein n=1 Tax=Halomarina rubra TaxID=2071873 RepID=A0ABD6ARL8_9EURY|nr:hypothetical protein [Halomarina rubra]
MAFETHSIANPQKVSETIPGAMRSATDVEVFDSRTDAARCRGLTTAGPSIDGDDDAVVLRMHNAGFSGGRFLSVDRTTLDALVDTNALR